MSDLPDNYDPADDISAVDDELFSKFRPEHSVILSFQRLQFYILELQRIKGEPQKQLPDDELVQQSSPLARPSRCARLWNWSPVKYVLHPCTGGLSCKGDCCPDEPPGAKREPDLIAKGKT